MDLKNYSEGNSVKLNGSLSNIINDKSVSNSKKKFCEMNSQGIENSFDNKSGSKNSNHFQQLHPILSNLIDLRDSLYFSQKPSLCNLPSIIVEIQKVDISSENTLDDKTRLLVGEVTSQISELCSKELEFFSGLIDAHNKIVEDTMGLLQIYKKSNSIRHHTSFNENCQISSIQKPKIRQQTDPYFDLLFIKYLLDNNLERPDKKRLRLLTFWTNLSEKTLNTRFSKKHRYYIKNYDQKSAREKLTERAIKICKQLRRPNSLKTSESSIKSKSNNRNSPYKRVNHD
nr:10741_t:CDS:1 [Entrophospora candida]CAG8627819.1 1831_t:CDS:1 [Entrophospora candida]